MTVAAPLRPLDEKFDLAMSRGRLPGLRHVLLYHDGVMLAERHYTDDDAPPQIRSITKSIVALLYGAALDRQLVPPPDQPLWPLFPALDDDQPDRRSMTIDHALTMTLGIEWNELCRFDSPLNSARQGGASGAPLDYLCSQRQVAPPGSRWIYCGPALDLLGTLIERGYDDDLESFAAEALFAPLGLRDVCWERDRSGNRSAATGLRLRPHDLLGIGRLVLDLGIAGDCRILPTEWVEQAIALRTPLPYGLFYGRLWYTGRAEIPGRPAPVTWAGAFGNGGQRLIVMPEERLILVVLCDNYDAPDAYITPHRIWKELVLANLPSRPPSND